MKKDKKILKSASVLTGALLATGLSAIPAFGSDILAYNNLGSGAELRSHLIDLNSQPVQAQEARTVKFAELKCGEGKCGEGKCGESDKKEATKKSESTEAKAAESTTSEAKSGEGEKKETKKKKK